MKINWLLVSVILSLHGAASSQFAPPPPERTAPWQLPVFLQLEREPDLARFYTAAMRARGLQGAVELDLAVDPSGKVTACKMKTSAIDADLAAASCPAAQTARFRKSAYGAPSMPLKLVWSVSNPQVIAARPGHPARLATPPFSSEFSYPSEAKQKGEEGRAFAEVDVSAAGQPTACRIRRSSGSASLDAATCQVMMTLGRYEPMVDVFNTPFAGVANGSMNWRLEAAVPASPPAQ